MAIFLIIFCFVCGAVAGSFITALVWREHEGRSMWEQHSVCPHCQHPLGPLDLVPIASWLLLRGKCRYCRTPIPAQYVLIELSTAVLFATTAVRIWQASTTYNLQPTTSLPWLLFAVLVTWITITLLVALFIFDLRWGELPNKWTLGGSVVALVAAVAALATRQPMVWQPNTYSVSSMVYNAAPSLNTQYSILNTLLSGILAALFFLAIVYGSEWILKKPGMGMGDVKLALLLGLFLGFPGIVVGLYLAFIFGTVISLGLISAKRAKLGMTVPFGPFMVAGAIAAIWITPLVVSWYQQFL